MAWWNKSKTDDSSVEGAQESKQAVWDSQTSAAIADARKAQSTRLGRTKKGEQSHEAPQARKDLPPALAERASKLFEPDAWRALVRMPFNLAVVWTGRKCNELDKPQEDTLAVSTAMTAEYFMVTDPRMLAVTICLINWSAVIADKIAHNAAERKKELALLPPKKESVNPQEPPHLVKV